jgi:hypothetical protein
LELLVDAAEDTTLTVELWDTGLAENYVPRSLVASAKIDVPAGAGLWVPASGLDWEPGRACNAFVIVRANEKIALHLSDEPLTGVLSFERGAAPHAVAELEDHDASQPIVDWSMKKLVRRPFCFRVLSTTEAYSPQKAVGGYKRPYGGPNLWASERTTAGAEQWLELGWDGPVAIREIIVTWNDDVNEDLINLHHHRTPFDVIPELAKHYRLEARNGGAWTVLSEVRGNRRRTNRFRFDRSVAADAIRVVIVETNGAPYAELVEVRVYE